MSRRQRRPKAAAAHHTAMVRSTAEVDLMMECVDDELSPWQLTANRKAQAEYNAAVERIRQAQAGNAQIVAGTPSRNNLAMDDDVIVLDDDETPDYIPSSSRRSRSRGKQTQAAKQARGQHLNITPAQQPVQQYVLQSISGASGQVLIPQQSVYSILPGQQLSPGQRPIGVVSPQGNQTATRGTGRNQKKLVGETKTKSRAAAKPKNATPSPAKQVVQGKARAQTNSSFETNYKTQEFGGPVQKQQHLVKSPLKLKLSKKSSPRGGSGNEWVAQTLFPSSPTRLERRRDNPHRKNTGKLRDDIVTPCSVIITKSMHLAAEIAAKHGTRLVLNVQQSPPDDSVVPSPSTWDNYSDDDVLPDSPYSDNEEVTFTTRSGKVFSNATTSVDLETKSSRPTAHVKAQSLKVPGKKLLNAKTGLARSGKVLSKSFSKGTREAVSNLPVDKSSITTRAKKMKGDSFISLDESPVLSKKTDSRSLEDPQVPPKRTESKQKVNNNPCDTNVSDIVQSLMTSSIMNRPPGTSERTWTFSSGTTCRVGRKADKVDEIEQIKLELDRKLKEEKLKYDKKVKAMAQKQKQQLARLRKRSKRDARRPYVDPVLKENMNSTDTHITQNRLRNRLADTKSSRFNSTVLREKLVKKNCHKSSGLKKVGITKELKVNLRELNVKVVNHVPAKLTSNLRLAAQKSLRAASTKKSTRTRAKLNTTDSKSSRLDPRGKKLDRLAGRRSSHKKTPPHSVSRNGSRVGDRRKNYTGVQTETRSPRRSTRSSEPTLSRGIKIEIERDTSFGPLVNSLNNEKSQNLVIGVIEGVTATESEGIADVKYENVESVAGNTVSACGIKLEPRDVTGEVVVIDASNDKVNDCHSQKGDYKVVSGTYGLGIKRSPADAGLLDPSPNKRGRGGNIQGSPLQPVENTGAWVPLDEYYYGKKEGDPAYREEKGEFRFKCWYCHKMLYNNMRIMMHMQGHIDTEKQQKLDLSDITQCKHCYKQFDTPFEMQCHVEKIHQNKSNVLVCRICEKDHDSQTSLRSHMRNYHTSCEMPYLCQLCNFRSSIYSDVVDHFKKRHDSSHHLMCLYCLKVFKVNFSKGQGWGLTQNYYQHLQKHQIKNVIKKCTACKLTFHNKQDAKNHKQKDHMANYKGTKASAMGLSTTTPNKEQVMIKLLDTSNPKVAQPKSLNAPVSSKVRELKGLKYSLGPEADEIKCIECKTIMGSPEHFKKYVECSLCRYATTCSHSYISHMLGFHSGKGSIQKGISPEEKEMPDVAFCLCGFSSKFGNSMANHMVTCSKRTCYKNPPQQKIIEYDDEQEDFDPFGSDVDEPDEPEDSTPKAGNEMFLGILGLVKKPNKSANSRGEQAAVNDRELTSKEIAETVIDDMLDVVFPAEAAAAEFMCALLDRLDKELAPEDVLPVMDSTNLPPSELIPEDLKGEQKWSTVRINEKQKPTRSSIFGGLDQGDENSDSGNKYDIKEEEKDETFEKEENRQQRLSSMESDLVTDEEVKDYSCHKDTDDVSDSCDMKDETLKGELSGEDTRENATTDTAMEEDTTSKDVTDQPDLQETRSPAEKDEGSSSDVTDKADTQGKETEENQQELERDMETEEKDEEEKAEEGNEDNKRESDMETRENAEETEKHIEQPQDSPGKQEKTSPTEEAMFDDMDEDVGTPIMDEPMGTDYPQPEAEEQDPEKCDEPKGEEIQEEEPEEKSWQESETKPEESQQEDETQPEPPQEEKSSEDTTQEEETSQDADAADNQEETKNEEDAGGRDEHVPRSDYISSGQDPEGTKSDPEPKHPEYSAPEPAPTSTNPEESDIAPLVGSGAEQPSQSLEEKSTLPTTEPQPQSTSAPTQASAATSDRRDGSRGDNRRSDSYSRSDYDRRDYDRREYDRDRDYHRNRDNRDRDYYRRDDRGYNRDDRGYDYNYRDNYNRDRYGGGGGYHGNRDNYNRHGSGHNRHDNRQGGGGGYYRDNRRGGGGSGGGYYNNRGYY